MLLILLDEILSIISQGTQISKWSITNSNSLKKKNKIKKLINLLLDHISGKIFFSVIYRLLKGLSNFFPNCRK